LKAAWAACLALLIALEIGAAKDASAFDAIGPKQPMAAFGERAFSSNFAVEIRKRDGR
jgi:hypothetical protein